MCWILLVQVRPTKCYKCPERGNVWKPICHIYLASYQTLYIQNSVWCYPLTFKQRTALCENIAHSLHNSLLVLITALVIYAMFLVRDKSDQPVVSWTPPPPKQGWVWVCPTGSPPHRSRFPLIIIVTITKVIFNITATITSSSSAPGSFNNSFCLTSAIFLFCFFIPFSSHFEEPVSTTRRRQMTLRWQYSTNLPRYSSAVTCRHKNIFFSAVLLLKWNHFGQ